MNDRLVSLLVFFASVPLTGIVFAQSPTTHPAIYDSVGIDQKLDAQVPLDLSFRDERGRTVKLAELIHEKPVVLTLVYYNCPSLCTMVLNELTNAMNAVSMTAGKEFDVITVSFDPSEDAELAMQKKMAYLRHYQRATANAGWHFLTGEQSSIDQLTGAVGFRYAWDKKFQQYVHASGIIVLTPAGKVSRYFYGVRYEPRDLRLAITEASQGRISSPVEQILLYCFHYDPATGKYSLAITRIVQLASIATMLVIGSFIVRNVRRDRAAVAVAAHK